MLTTYIKVKRTEKRTNLSSRSVLSFRSSYELEFRALYFLYPRAPPAAISPISPPSKGTAGSLGGGGVVGRVG